MLSEFSREERELTWQPNLGKKSKNCTDFSSLHDIETLFACMVGFSGSADTNMLSEFSREQRELPWQPNLGKNKLKVHCFQLYTRYRDVFACMIGFSGSAETNMLSECSRELPQQRI